MSEWKRGRRLRWWEPRVLLWNLGSWWCARLHPDWVVTSFTDNGMWTRCPKCGRTAWSGNYYIGDLGSGESVSIPLADLMPPEPRP